MTYKLVWGINPLVIAYVEAYQGVRYGRHPLFYRRLKQRFGVLTPFVRYCIDLLRDSDNAHWQVPRVVIYNADRKVIKAFAARNNAHAMALRDEAIATINAAISRG